MPYSRFIQGPIDGVFFFKFFFFFLILKRGNGLVVLIEEHTDSGFKGQGRTKFPPLKNAAYYFDSSRSACRIQLALKPILERNKLVLSSSSTPSPYWCAQVNRLRAHAMNLSMRRAVCEGHTSLGRHALLA